MKEDFYYIPTGITKEVSNTIIDYINNDRYLKDNFIDGETRDNVDGVRNCKVLWVPKTNWITGLMHHFITQANEEYFKYDLNSLVEGVQYTVYSGKGTKYSWHTDDIDSFPTYITNDSSLRRKLSISLLLSDPSEYEGGEFQLMIGGRRDMITIKPPLGYAIIFPSTSMHRVRPLKSGKRISLVSWCAGPKFR